MTEEQREKIEADRRRDDHEMMLADGLENKAAELLCYFAFKTNGSTSRTCPGCGVHLPGFTIYGMKYNEYLQKITSARSYCYDCILMETDAMTSKQTVEDC